jgi:signal transduction histidine kinase/DNA-binding response OmpR family regulator
MFDAIDGLPIAIAVDTLEAQSKLVFVNRQFTRTFGYTLEDIPTVERWAELAYPDPSYRAAVFETWDAAVARAVNVHGHVESMEFQVCCKDRSVRDVVFSANVLNNLLIVTLTDVTQRRAIERELASARARLERTAYEITENIPVGTYTMVQPADGGMARFSFLSSKFLALTGLNRKDALEDPMKAFACVHPEDFDEWVRLNVDVFEKKTRFYGETRLIVNGQVRWISAESVPRELPDGSTVWEGVLTDITELQESRQAMLEAKTKAEQQEKLKSDFLANMSHEIRTPLTSILGLVQLLAREPLNTKHREMILTMQDAGDSLMRIVDEVLDYSRIEAGQLRIEPQPFKLADLLAKIEDLQRLMASKRGIALNVAPAPSLSGTLLGDSFRIEQIMNNLVNNAIKFTPSGHVAVNASVVSAQKDKCLLRLEVEDTGQGITEDFLAKLFVPFYQADSGSSRRFGGSGLGLSISKRLTELMGGRIGVESTPGKGSLFWLELPMTLIAQAAAQKSEVSGHQPLPHPSRQAENLNGLTILIVDDSPSILAMVREMLQAEGAWCLLAENATQAIEKLREESAQIDAVLMDIQMPEIDGLTAMQQIRQQPQFSGLPLIAMTAGILQEQQAQAMAAGANDIVHKPIRMDFLVRCLLKWTRPHRVQDNGMPQLDKINAAHAFKTMNGNGEMFTRLLRLFLEEHAEAVALARKDMNEGFKDRAARRLHTIRGGAGQLGALELQSAAQAAEQAIATQSANIEEALLRVEHEVNALGNACRTLSLHS